MRKLVIKNENLSDDIRAVIAYMEDPNLTSEEEAFYSSVIRKVYPSWREITAEGDLVVEDFFRSDLGTRLKAVASGMGIDLNQVTFQVTFREYVEVGGLLFPSRLRFSLYSTKYEELYCWHDFKRNVDDDYIRTMLVEVVKVLRLEEHLRDARGGN